MFVFRELPQSAIKQSGSCDFSRPTCAKRRGSVSPLRAPLLFKLDTEFKYYSYVFCVFNFKEGEYGDAPSTKNG
jgi:hypothetical protein